MNQTDNDEPVAVRNAVDSKQAASAAGIERVEQASPVEESPKVSLEQAVPARQLMSNGIDIRRIPAGRVREILELEGKITSEVKSLGMISEEIERLNALRSQMYAGLQQSRQEFERVEKSARLDAECVKGKSYVIVMPEGFYAAGPEGMPIEQLAAIARVVYGAIDVKLGAP